MAAVRRCWPLPCAHCTSARSEAYAAPLLPRPPGCRRRGGEAGAGSSRGAGLPAVPAAAAFPLPSFAPACGPHSCHCPHPLVCSFAHTPWLPCLASSFLFRRLCRSPQPTAARCPASCCECSCRCGPGRAVAAAGWAAGCLCGVLAFYCAVPFRPRPPPPSWPCCINLGGLQQAAPRLLPDPLLPLPCRAAIERADVAAISRAGCHTMTPCWTAAGGSCGRRC